MEKWELFLAFVMPEWYLAPLTMSVFQQTTPSATNQPKTTKATLRKKRENVPKFNVNEWWRLGGSNNESYDERHSSDNYFLECCYNYPYVPNSRFTCGLITAPGYARKAERKQDFCVL